MYTGDINNSESVKEVEEEDEEIKKALKQATWEHLVRCFILGIFLDAPIFRNTVMDQIFTMSKMYLNTYGEYAGYYTADIKLVWMEETTENSPLRQIILDQLISGSTDLGPWLDNLVGTPAEDVVDFLKDLAYAGIMAARDPDHAGDFLDRDPCLYHDHPGKPEGYSCTSK